MGDVWKNTKSASVVCSFLLRQRNTENRAARWLFSRAKLSYHGTEHKLKKCDGTAVQQYYSDIIPRTAGQQDSTEHPLL